MFLSGKAGRWHSSSNENLFALRFATVLFVCFILFVCVFVPVSKLVLRLLISRRVLLVKFGLLYATRGPQLGFCAILILRENLWHSDFKIPVIFLIFREAIITLESLGVEPTGDLEMVEAIRKEVRRLCRKDAIVAHILHEDHSAEYTSDYKRLFTTDNVEGLPTRVASRTTKQGSRAVSRATSDSSRGWDPILAGYQARERMSRAPTPGDLVMRRSFLPLDLNSTSSENSVDMNLETWDELSESSVDEGESESETDQDEVPEEDTDIKNERDFQIEKGIQSVDGGATIASVTSPSKVEFSDDRGVESALPSALQDGNGDQDGDTFFELESNKDDPELLNLADEISEHNVTSSNEYRSEGGIESNTGPVPSRG